MRRKWVAWVLFVAILLATRVPAFADGRVALVIGNANYQNVPQLLNPVNDAVDLAAALNRLGFKVKLVTNASFDDMRHALIDFDGAAVSADIALIFFSGHGLEIQGENWLVPVDAKLATDRNVANETIGLKAMTDAVSAARRLGLVILDACRSNPFLVKMRTTNLSRAVERGFSRVEPTDNVLVAYAARDGTTARDGTGRNSPFTASLLHQIEIPNLEIRFMFASVRDEVMDVTNREQQPFVYGSLSKDPIFLSGGRNDRATATNADSREEVVWSFVEQSKDPNNLRQFLAEFPASAHRGQAEARIAALKPQASVSSAPKEMKKDGDRFGSNADQSSARQRAVLYDEDPSDPQGRRYEGSVVWSSVNVGDAGGTKNVAVQGIVEIPDKALNLVFQLRRNVDTSLPASHTIELTFTNPENRPERGVANVPGLLMKNDEKQRGTPLAGVAVKVTDGFFLVGLSNVEADRARNVKLLKEDSWFDIPIVYGNQRRAILALEKGQPGQQTYAQAFQAWGQ